MRNRHGASTSLTRLHPIMPRGKKKVKRLESGLDAVDDRNVLRAMLRSACFTKCCSVTFLTVESKEDSQNSYIKNIIQLKWFWDYVISKLVWPISKYLVSENS